MCSKYGGIHTAGKYNAEMNLMANHRQETNNTKKGLSVAKTCTEPTQNRQTKKEEKESVNINRMCESSSNDDGEACARQYIKAIPVRIGNRLVCEQSRSSLRLL